MLTQRPLFWSFLCSHAAEAKQQKSSDSRDAISTEAFKSAAALLPEPGAQTVAGKARGQSGSALLRAPTKVISQKCTMLLRKNALITPLNGPAASCGEWVGSNPAEHFRELHDYYGQEVKKAREEWLKGRGEEEQRGQEDLIALG